MGYQGPSDQAAQMTGVLQVEAERDSQVQAKVCESTAGVGISNPGGFGDRVAQLSNQLMAARFCGGPE